MDENEFEEKLSAFWEANDEWLSRRLQAIADTGTTLDEQALAAAENSVEENLGGMIAQSLQTHGFSFPPDIFHDLHHLLFELELKELNIDNSAEIHRYKDNAQVALSVIEGKLTPVNAELVMMLNRSHHEKKGGNDDTVCADCICGRK
ncbi:MAG: hypothetical protein FJ119_11880 [Deltaproteobacteria bacterium]|nr:hypothetical protein [Deltaproteobacteria bacterium]